MNYLEVKGHPSASTSGRVSRSIVHLHHRSSQNVATRLYNQALASSGVSGPAPARAISGSLRRQVQRQRMYSSAVTSAVSHDSSSVSSGGKEEVAILGGGCFWCIETCFNQLQGVKSAISGYAGGHVENPTYEQICGKRTGHAEVVKVTYDPSIIDFRMVLKIFFSLHDPTQKDRQGNDVGPQYRSCIFYLNDEQKKISEEVMKEVKGNGWWSAPVVTELSPYTNFYEAEKYHQRYYERNPSQGYCSYVVGPKVAKFRSKWAKLLTNQPASL